MKQILFFFSYARTDKDFALKLAKDLREGGVKLWIDQLDIKFSSRWDESIEKALEEAGGMIVILSPASVASNNVMDEVAYVLENNKTVIPVLHADCKLSFRLRRLQHIDFTVEANYAHNLNLLIDTIRYLEESKTSDIQVDIETETITEPDKVPVKTAEPVEFAPKTEQPSFKEPAEIAKKESKPNKNEIRIIIGVVFIFLFVIILIKCNDKKAEDYEVETADTTAVDTASVLVDSATIGYDTASLQPSNDPAIESIRKSMKTTKHLDNISVNGLEASYYGETINDVPNGNGTGTFSDYKYTGNWKSGKPEGNGTRIYKSGAKYIGEFKNEEFDGQGTYINPNKSKYVGSFERDRFNGEGTFYSAEGFYVSNCVGCKKYIGNWVDDIKQGYGRCYDANSKLIYEGYFENDKPVSPYPNR